MMSDVTTAPAPRSDRGPLAPTLNAVGAIVVGFWVVVRYLGGEDAVVVGVVSLIALVAWVVRAYFRRTAVQDVASAVMVVAGSAMVESTDGLLITPVIVAIATITADLRHRLVTGLVTTLVSAVIVIIDVISTGASAQFLLGVFGGLAVGLIVGYSRRQNRVAAVRERELLDRQIEVEREQERSALLADRATMARDIHDVLAHSLGGLVIQLDAVEALLENGRVEDATERVVAARTLAAEGLSEARRAVAALRDPERAVGDREDDALAAPEAIDRLFEVHRSLGGRVSIDGGAALDRLDAPHRRALAGVLRESLSNARRHAPSEDVNVVFSLAEDRLLHATIANTLTSTPAAVAPSTSSSGGAPDSASSLPPTVGGGHGLPGMRERLAALGDESTVTAGPVGQTFVVDARVVAS